MRFIGPRSVSRAAFISLLALSSLGIACLAWDPVSGLTPDDLPMDGEVLVVGKDARLEIPIGSAATINGTIRAMGNSTCSPRLSIDNQGNLTVQRAMMESLNSSVVITNKGTVSGNGLGLHPGRGGSINLTNRGNISLQEVTLLAEEGGRANLFLTAGSFNTDRAEINVSSPVKGRESCAKLNQSGGNLKIGGLWAYNRGELGMALYNSTTGPLVVESFTGSRNSISVEDLTAEYVALEAINASLTLNLNGTLETRDLDLNGGQSDSKLDGKTRKQGLDIKFTEGAGGNLTLTGSIETQVLIFEAASGAVMNLDSMFGEITADSLRILASKRSNINAFNGEWKADSVLVRNSNASINLQHQGYDEFVNLRIEGDGGGTTNLAISGTGRAGNFEILNNGSHINIANSGFGRFGNLTLVELAAETSVFNSGYIHADILKLIAREIGVINITNCGVCDFNRTAISTNWPGAVNINTMFGTVTIGILVLNPTGGGHGDSINIFGGENIEVSTLDIQAREIRTEVRYGKNRTVVVFPDNSTVTVDNPGRWLPIPEPVRSLAALFVGFLLIRDLISRADQECTDLLWPHFDLE